VPVDRLRKKRNGELAYQAECQGIAVTPPEGTVVLCGGTVELRAKSALSFGAPFVTHSYLCTAHAAKLGFA
jgi:hypothetical protein